MDVQEQMEEWQNKLPREVVEKLAGKIYAGEKEKNKRVLDVGAGLRPDSRATHAIDVGCFPEPPEKIRPDVFQDVEYETCFDVSSKKLPYEDDYFDQVVSHSSVGWTVDKPGHVLNEIHRVLKDGGNIELRIPEYDHKMFSVLSRAGFHTIKATPPLGTYKKQEFPTNLWVWRAFK